MPFRFRTPVAMETVCVEKELHFIKILQEGLGCSDDKAGYAAAVFQVRHETQFMAPRTEEIIETPVV